VSPTDFGFVLCQLDVGSALEVWVAVLQVSDVLICDEGITFCITNLKPTDNWLKSRKSCCLTCISFVTGVGMNLSPFASKFIWSFVSSLSERFLICFLFASIFKFDRFCCLILLRSALFVCYAGFRSFRNGPMFVVRRHVYFSTCLFLVSRFHFKLTNNIHLNINYFKLMRKSNYSSHCNSINLPPLTLAMW